VQRYTETLFYLTIPLHYTQTISRDGRHRSARRYSNVPCAGIPLFLFNVLQLVFGFFNDYI